MIHFWTFLKNMLSCTLFNLMRMCYVSSKLIHYIYYTWYVCRYHRRAHSSTKMNDVCYVPNRKLIWYQVMTPLRLKLAINDWLIWNSQSNWLCNHLIKVKIDLLEFLGILFVLLSPQLLEALSWGVPCTVPSQKKAHYRISAHPLL